MPNLPYEFVDRASAFWERVDRSAGPEACWTWKGAVTAQHGYGCFQVGKGKVLGAHKIAWLLTNGHPGELCVLHRCDNRVCVNPAHLFLGTKKDNSDDKFAKRRHPTILTPESVREIRQLLAEGRMMGKDIAARYGVVPTVITSIKTGRLWRNVQ